MRTRFHLGSTAVLAALLLTSCLALTRGDVQAFRLFFTLNQTLADGQQVEAHSSVFPAEVKVRRNFVKLFGRFTPAPGAALPDRIEIEVTLAALGSQQVYYTFRQEVAIDADGSFSATKRFLRNLKADTLQTVFVRPVGGALARDTKVAFCLEVSKKKVDLSADGTCGPGGGGGGQVTEVRVLDNSFDPRGVSVDPGETVRWVLAGAATNHTVTHDGGVFDSGLVLQTQGATFERTFSAADDGQTFLYYCRTHQACCAMQGSVQVGNPPQPPPPGYE